MLHFFTSVWPGRYCAPSGTVKSATNSAALVQVGVGETAGVGESKTRPGVGVAPLRVTSITGVAGAWVVSADVAVAAVVAGASVGRGGRGVSREVGEGVAQAASPSIET